MRPRAESPWSSEEGEERNVAPEHLGAQAASKARCAPQQQGDHGPWAGADSPISSWGLACICCRVWDLLWGSVSSWAAGFPACLPGSGKLEGCNPIEITQTRGWMCNILTCACTRTHGQKGEVSVALAWMRLQKHKKTPRREMSDQQDRSHHLRDTTHPVENAWLFSSPLSNSPPWSRESSLMAQVHTAVTLCHLLVKGWGLPLQESCLPSAHKERCFLTYAFKKLHLEMSGELSCCRATSPAERNHKPKAVREDRNDKGVAKHSPGLPSLMFLSPGEITFEHIFSVRHWDTLIPIWLAVHLWTSCWWWANPQES